MCNAGTIVSDKMLMGGMPPDHLLASVLRDLEVHSGPRNSTIKKPGYGPAAHLADNCGRQLHRFSFIIHSLLYLYIKNLVIVCK